MARYRSRIRPLADHGKRQDSSRAGRFVRWVYELWIGVSGGRGAHAVFWQMTGRIGKFEKMLWDCSQSSFFTIGRVVQAHRISSSIDKNHGWNQFVLAFSFKSLLFLILFGLRAKWRTHSPGQDLVLWLGPLASEPRHEQSQQFGRIFIIIK